MHFLLVTLSLLLVSGLMAQVPDLEAYRQHALRQEGNVARGKDLFESDRMLCAKCHSVDGTASKAGPDLYAAGDAFGRRDLIKSVLDPSATIAPGYEMLVVETRQGETFAGTLKQKTAEKVELMGMDGERISIPVSEITQEGGSPVSLMPPGLHATLSLEEFTDLIEYLVSLKEPTSRLVSREGAPLELPVLEAPVSCHPLNEAPFELQSGRRQTGLTSMRQVPGFPEVFLVLHQEGIIWRWKRGEGGEKRSVFSDLTEDVFWRRGPNGLQDVAFHPRFRENRLYYLFYQIFEDDVVKTRVVEKRFSEDFLGDSGEPERLLMKIASVAADHSGGCLAFGDDGCLYLVMGDTGPHHDPNGHAQNLNLLLGKILRIDVDRRDPGLPYAIPDDNPFVGEPGVRPEIWAYGLRNPWRFCFDRLTGDLWVADVGQDRAEEVAIVRKGENHGWNVYEGFEAFSNQYRKEDAHYISPLFTYRRRYGNSITGGHVYRGDHASSFYGVYVCGDYNSKMLFGITKDNRTLTEARVIGEIPQRLVSFCEDEAGQLYAIGYEGTIYGVDFSAARFE